MSLAEMTNYRSTKVATFCVFARMQDPVELHGRPLISA